MKKALNITLLTIFLCFILSGCNLVIPIDTLKGKKPNNFYYTNLLAKNLALEKNYKCTVLETNFYKGKEFNEEDRKLLENFFKLLNKNNFINKPKDLKEKPLYKIFFTFKKSKYIINIYNEKYISVQPFDGDYTMDYIDIQNIPEAYNLYNLSKFMFHKQ